jgi:hypothetical protein
MTTALTAWRRALCVGLASAALGGCGGGGGGGGASTPPNPTGDANPAGLWQGPLITTGDNTQRVFSVILAPDGRFTGIIASSGTNGRFVVGTVDTTLNTLNATGTVFAQAGEGLLPNGLTSDPLTVSDATIVEHVSLRGSYTGGGESASFELAYEGGTTRGASLAAIAGVYSIYPPVTGSVAATLAVNGNALTFATASGCNGTGTIEVIDPKLDMYSWSMLLGPCAGTGEYTFSGLASLNDNPRAGGAGNLIALYGATAAHDVPFVFRGAK